MNDQVFAYDIYIRTTPERLWAALTQPEFTARYFHGTHVVSDWKPGSPVIYRYADGRGDVMKGEVIESDPPRKLVISWRFVTRPEFEAEKPSRATFEILDKGNGVVQLAVTHDDFPPDSETFRAINPGWPPILSSLKSLLETGEAMALPT